jgi:hypothetical protein
MKQDEIKQLLEQYWRCETSIDNEKTLADFFANNPVPENLKPYKTLFLWKEKQKRTQCPPARTASPKRTLIQYLYPALKIAASVLIVTTFGIGIYTHYQQEQWIDKLFTESAPGATDVWKDSTEVVAKASWQALPESEKDSLPPIGNRQQPPTEIQKK